MLSATPRDVVVLVTLGLLLTGSVAFTAPSSGVKQRSFGIPASSEALAPVSHGPESHTWAASPPFIWPVSGGITSFFGPGHPLGIDISLASAPNAAILAAAPGEVVHAGGSICCGYGLYVIIDHGLGLTTRYGHLARIDVEEGQQVQHGHVLGIGGNTGYSTSRHLHFEVRQDNKPIDPLSLLPPTCKGLPGRHREIAVELPGGCIGLETHP